MNFTLNQFKVLCDGCKYDIWLQICHFSGSGIGTGEQIYNSFLLLLFQMKYSYEDILHQSLKNNEFLY